MLQHRIYDSATRQLFRRPASRRACACSTSAAVPATWRSCSPTSSARPARSSASRSRRSRSPSPPSGRRLRASRPPCGSSRPTCATSTLDEGQFDAVVGRWVLMYQPDPVALLRRLAGMLRSGGVVAFQESDLVAVHRPYPAGAAARAAATRGCSRRPTAASSSAWVRSCSRRSSPPGCPTRPCASTRPSGAARTGSATSTSRPRRAACCRCSRRSGSSTCGEVDVDTLADRLRDEIVDHHGVQPLASVYGAWARVP